MNRNLGRALAATLLVTGTGLATQSAAQHVDGRLISAALLVAMLTGTLLLHRRGGLADRGMSATTWRSFSAAGVVLVATATADLAIGVLDGRGFWTGLPLATGTLVAGPLLLRGLVRWNPSVHHVLDQGHGLTTTSAVLALVGAGNLLLPWLPGDLTGWNSWQVQVWLLTVAVMVVLVGTCCVVARTAGLARDARLVLLTGCLLALTVVDSSVALTGGAALLAVQGSTAAGVVVMGAAVLRARTPRPALVGATVPAGGAMLVLVVAFAVVAAACAQGAGVVPILWGGLAVLGSGLCLVRHVGQLSDLARARTEARTDELTGVGNRRALVDHTDRLAEAGSAAALLKIDLDDFGLLNQRLGHHVGDQVLREVAQTLRGAAPATAVTVRTAGDTFAVLLPEADEPRALAVADDLTRSLGSRTAAIGVATAARGQTHTDDLLHRAAAALAVARAGRTGIAVFDAELEARARDRVALAADFAAALADPTRREAELLLNYQPQLEIGAGDGRGHVVGVEALVRWHHPDRGLLSPDTFLDLAEEHGHMDALTAHLLDRATRESARWSSHGRPLRVSVNLSAGSLAAPELLPMVDEVLQRNAFDPERLVLEITETTLMSDPALAVAVTESLVARGISLSIDDYGTGYSSLAYLTDLPATELKLDRAFTLRITSELRTAAIVEGTVALAHRLGLRVIAEGVEDLPTLAVLRDLGVDETQGYLHARPLDPQALRTWLAGHAPEPEPVPA